MKKQIYKHLSQSIISNVEQDSKLVYLLNFIFNSFFALKSDVITLKAIDKVREESNILIKTEQTLFGLKTLNDSIQTVVTNNVQLGYSLLHNCLVNCNSPFVVKQNVAYYQQYNLNTPFNKINIVGGGIKAHGKKLAWWRKPQKPLTIDEGIIINGSYITNWYHWQIETLSKVSLLPYLPREFDNYPLLVSKSILESKNHTDLLKLAAPKRNIIALQDESSHLIKSCIFIDSPIIAPPAFKEKGRVELIGDHTLVRKLLIEYRNNIISNTVCQTTHYNYPDKVFLLRKQNRRKYNQDEIYSLFKQFGFSGIYLEDLSVEEQIRYFNNAQQIIGPVGAAWANIIYAKPNTICMYWTASFIKEGIPFSNLAGNLDINLLVIHFDVDQDLFFSSEKHHHVSPDLLMNAYLAHIKNDTRN